MENRKDEIRKEIIRYLPYCDDISQDTKDKWISWLENQKDTEDNKKKTDGAIIRNFTDGKKVYFPWFNSSQGKFVVLDKVFTDGHGFGDRYDIMLCETWDEANTFAYMLNRSIQSTIDQRKELLRNG